MAAGSVVNASVRAERTAIANASVRADRTAIVNSSVRAGVPVTSRTSARRGEPATPTSSARPEYQAVSLEVLLRADFTVTTTMLSSPRRPAYRAMHLFVIVSIGRKV